MVVRSFSTGGGLELYAHKVIEGLLARGLKVTVICEETKTDFKHRDLNLVHFRAPDRHWPKWRKLKHQFAAATEAVRSSGPFDLVHSQHFPVAEADVVTFHNHSVPHLSTVGSSWENLLNKTKALIVPAYRMRDHYDRILCLRARSFIFPSHVCRDDFCRAYQAICDLGHTPYVVARPGSELAIMESPPAQDESPFPAEALTFLFVGRGFRRKGLDTLLKACSILRSQDRDFKLLVAGLPGKSLDSLRLAALGIQANVEYLGFRNDMASVYRQASIFVMPSRHDVFGMAPLQAMQSGLVPIVSRCMGVSELMSDHRNALILENHLDAKKLAALMRELIDDRELLQSLRSSVKAVAKATTWDKCAEATLDAYRLAKSSPGSEQPSGTASG